MKIVYLAVDESWFRRLATARAARDAGAEIIVMAPFQKFHSVCEAEGFRVIRWHMSRRSLNPAREMMAFYEVMRAYKNEKPDMVHHLALKAIIYGGAAARWCGGIATVNTAAGLGRVFTISTTLMRLLRRMLFKVLRFVFGLPNCKVTFENEDDRDCLVSNRIVKREKTAVISGVGIEFGRFHMAPEPAGPTVVMLPSRMLWEKGVAQFVEAARLVKKSGIIARFVLVGSPDFESRGFIPENQLRAWADSGDVEWWGPTSDMAATLSQTNIVCLPSYYREGIPRILMEACASGRAIVTTDMPGCRHAVRHGENGLLVPPKDPISLAEALSKLIENPELRKQMGIAGHARALREFSEDTIVPKTFAVYRDLLNSNWPPVFPQSNVDLENCV